MMWVMLGVVWFIVMLFAWALCSMNAGHEVACTKCGYVHEGLTIDCPNCGYIDKHA